MNTTNNGISNSKISISFGQTQDLHATNNGASTAVSIITSR